MQITESDTVFTVHGSVAAEKSTPLEELGTQPKIALNCSSGVEQR